MRKAAVFSFFESYNIGDVLIARQVKEIFSKQDLNCDFFDIVSGKSEKECGLMKSVSSTPISKFKKKIVTSLLLGDFIHFLSALKSTSYKKICRAAETYDTVIFAGGNQVMELGMLPSSIIGTYRAVKTLKKSGKKIAFCFCGIGPFKSCISKKIAKKIFTLADFVSVRDDYSREWAEKFLPQKQVEIWCDPVLMVAPERKVLTLKNAVGINAYFGHDARYRAKMRKSYIRLIKKLRQRNKDLTINLFSSELTDIDDLKTLKSDFLNDQKVIVRNIDSKESLFEFYGEIDAVIATRMHTAITSTICGLPILTIAWQSKVSSFMSYMENSEFNFAISEFISNSDTVNEKLDYVLENLEKIVDRNMQKLKLLNQGTKEKINRFFEELRE